MSIFPGLTLMGLLALGLLWPPGMRSMSRLWALVCWSPSTAMAPGPGSWSPTSLEKAKCPQIFTDRATVSAIKWVSLNHCPSSIHYTPITLIMCPYPWHDRFITELSIEIITPIRSEIRNQSFYFPSDRMCQACVRQTGVTVTVPVYVFQSMNIHCIFCQLRLSQVRTRLEVAATLYSLWYESSFQEPNFHVMRL